MGFRKTSVQGYQIEGESGTIEEGCLEVVVACLSGTVTVQGGILDTDWNEVDLVAAWGSVLEPIHYDASGGKIQIWEIRYGSYM